MRLSKRSLALPAVLALLLLVPSAASALTQTDLDSSYGAAGIATPAVPAIDSDFAVATQADGKIIGAHVTGAGAPIAYRLNLDGSLDSSFGTGGIVGLAVLGAADLDIGRALVAADGTIYLAGEGSVAGFTRDAIWALTPGGTPKLGFNGTGSILLPTVSGSDNLFADAALSPAGQIVVAAEAESGADVVISLRVVSATGIVTTNVTRDFPGNDAAPSSVTVLPDGRVILGISIAFPGGIISGLLSASLAGVFDGSFGSGGGVAYFGPPIPLFGIPFRTFNLGGRIAAVGMIGYVPAIGIYSPAGISIPEIGDFSAARFLPPGATFAMLRDGGAVGSGKVVAVGVASGASELPAYVVRYNGDGSPDTSFAPSGVSYLPAAEIGTPRFVLQPDGKYVIAVQRTDGSLTLRRIWGDSPAPPAPQPATIAFSSSVKSKQKARKAKKISGITGGTGVTRVELAIQKVDSKLLKKKRRCTYVKSKSASLKKYKTVKGKCVPGIWLKASGTGSWSFKLSKALKPGKYVVSARATGILGVSPVVTKSVTLTK